MCPASWVLPRNSWGLRETTTNMSTLNLPSGVIKRGMLENQPFLYGISHCHVWLLEGILFYTWDKSKSNCESTHQIWQTKNKTNQIEVFQVDPHLVEVYETPFHFHRISWNKKTIQILVQSKQHILQPDPECITGWWFGTFFIFPYIGNNHPNWLSYFSERLGSTTNQIIYTRTHKSIAGSRGAWIFTGPHSTA